MNYTKFLSNLKSFKKSENKSSKSYNLLSTDEKIKISSEILKDIQKTKILLQNYIRIDFKFDIDEYMAYFLKDKNEFINEFKEYLEAGVATDKNGNPYRLSLMEKKNYLAILEILKSEIDVVLRDFKNLKQKMLKKMNKKENFWKLKENFIKSYKESDGDKQTPYVVSSVSNILQSNISKFTGQIKPEEKKSENKITKISYKESNIPIVPMENFSNSSTSDESTNMYRDSAATLSYFKESETKDYEKTKTILFELSDLMTNFSAKVLEHQNITQNSNRKIKLIFKSFT
jgi:hypothetical protein